MKNLLFLNLTAFSQMGGLEKFNRCFMKAANAIEQDGDINTTAYSMYDTVADEKYYPAKKYKGFSQKRIGFVLSSLLKSRKNDVIVLGHINLSMVGYFIKKLYPSKKLVLICHGIEVWEPVSFFKKQVLQNADSIFAVSEFTRRQIAAVHGIALDKIKVFHNTIDPYFEVPKTFTKDNALMQRYGLKEDSFVLFALCRLSSHEMYKGYDEVIKVLPSLLKKYPGITYVIAGKYDELEKQRVERIIDELGVKDNVVLTGFIKTEEIIQHYQLADAYVMPSSKEGFGIVFIEAMACGVRVVAGNKDGSVDALKNGELGTLVDPANGNEIGAAIESYILSRTTHDKVAAKTLQQEVINNFGFATYTARLKGLLNQVINN